MTIAEVAKNSPIASEPEPALRWGHFVFEDVTWEFYEQTLEQLERAGQHAHVTFDNGRMEIMTTTGWHEGIKKSVARLLEHYSFVRDLPIQGFGNVTLKRKDLRKGFEPDECYYIASKLVTNKKGHADVKKGPPPDLIVEVQVTQSEVHKRPIYAAIGVPEIWAINSERLAVLKLEESQYVQTPRSRFFPKLDIAEFFRFVKLARLDQHEGVKAFDAWLRGAGAKQ
jgi:Uma2 family endonuclease